MVLTLAAVVEAVCYRAGCLAPGRLWACRLNEEDDAGR